jgi:putative copper resistance protein D
LSEAVSVILLSQAFSKFRIPFFSFLLLSMIFFGLVSARAFAQNPPMHHDHQGMSMPMDDDQDPAKLLADKKESEFNHHLAGVFVVLAGLFILTSHRLKTRWPAIKYAWPLCFLLSGVFVFVFSDTELWPFGPKDWWTGVTGNLEVLQHKTFAVILLGLGIIEILRAKGTLRAAWSAWIFPVLAVAGSVMLLFHAHEAGMHGEEAMIAMHRIQMQHFSYAAIGACIGLSRGLSDTSLPARRLFQRIWPLLTIALGVVLMFYTE